MRIWKKLIALIVTLAILAGLFFAGVAIAAKVHNQSVIDELRSWGSASNEISSEIESEPLS